MRSRKFSLQNKVQQQHKRFRHFSSGNYIYLLLYLRKTSICHSSNYWTADYVCINRIWHNLAKLYSSLWENRHSEALVILSYMDELYVISESFLRFRVTSLFNMSLRVESSSNTHRQSFFVCHYQFCQIPSLTSSQECIDDLHYGSVFFYQIPTLFFLRINFPLDVDNFRPFSKRVNNFHSY